MNYNSIIISMVLGIIFFDVLGNDKLEMKCTITEELENNKPALYSSMQYCSRGFFGGGEFSDKKLVLLGK